MTKSEHKEAKEYYSDEYIQGISRMTTSKIGGEIRWISDQSKQHDIAWANEKADKIVDGTMLYFSRMLLESLGSEEVHIRAKDLGIADTDIDDLYLLTEANIVLHQLMLSGYGFTSKEQYIRERGLDNLIAFIRGSAENTFKKPRTNTLPPIIGKLVLGVIIFLAIVLVVASFSSGI